MAMGKITCLALALLLTSTTAFSGELATPERQGDHVPASLKKLQEKILAREAAKGDNGIGKSHREKKALAAGSPFFKKIHSQPVESSVPEFIKKKIAENPDRSKMGAKNEAKREARRARRAASRAGRRTVWNCDETFEDHTGETCVIVLDGDDDYQYTPDAHLVCSNVCRTRGQVGGLLVPTGDEDNYDKMVDLCDDEGEGTSCMFGAIKGKVGWHGVWGVADDFHWMVDQGRSVEIDASDDFYYTRDLGDSGIPWEDQVVFYMYDGEIYPYYDSSEVDNDVAFCGCRDNVPISSQAEEETMDLDDEDCDDVVEGQCLTFMDYEWYGDNYAALLLQCQTTCQARGWEGTLAAPMNDDLNEAIWGICDDEGKDYCQVGVVHCGINSKGQWCPSGFDPYDPWYFITGGGQTASEVDDYDNWYGDEDTHDEGTVIINDEGWYSIPWPYEGCWDSWGLDADNVGAVCSCDMSRKDPGGAPGSVDDDDDDDDDDDSGGSGGGLNAVCETKYPDLIAETTVDETDTDGNGNEVTFGALIGGVTIDVPPDIGESCMSVEMKIQPFFLSGTKEVDSTGVFCYPCEVEVTPTITSTTYISDKEEVIMSIDLDTEMKMSNTIRFADPDVTSPEAQTVLVDQGEAIEMCDESDVMCFEVTPSLWMTIEQGSEVTGSGEYYETTESEVGVSTITNVNTAENEFEFEGVENGGEIGDAKIFGDDLEVESGGDNVAISIFVKMVIVPKMTMEEDKSTLDLFDGKMIQTIPMTSTFENLGNYDCMKSNKLSATMEMNEMTVGKMSIDSPVGSESWEGVDLIKDMEDSGVEMTQAVDIDTSSSSSCSLTSTAIFIEGEFSMETDSAPTEDDVRQLQLTMKSYLEETLSLETIVFSSFEVTYEEVNADNDNQRRSLLATYYIWTVNYELIVVDSNFDSGADLEAAITEAITDESFEEAIEEDLDIEVDIDDSSVEVDIDDSSVKTDAAESSKKSSSDGIDAASLGIYIGAAVGVMLMIAGGVFYCKKSKVPSHIQSEDVPVDELSIKEISLSPNVGNSCKGTPLDDESSMRGVEEINSSANAGNLKVGARIEL